MAGQNPAKQKGANMEELKIKELAELLEIKEEEAKELIENEDYLVLTDEEANEKAREYILDSLWAFNADFVIRHSKNYSEMTSEEYNEAVESLRNSQERSCEYCNGLVKALIDDIDEFVEDAE